ncbi:hypothetical protein ASG32_23110 [Methylobacterium sp. Leaf361]|nr:hypothetical protein ASG32_23110 [Methylobacterium sp. Leaf361]
MCPFYLIFEAIQVTNIERQLNGFGQELSLDRPRVIGQATRLCKHRIEISFQLGRNSALTLPDQAQSELEQS